MAIEQHSGPATLHEREAPRVGLRPRRWADWARLGLSFALSLVVGWGIGLRVGQPGWQQAPALAILSISGCDELLADPSGGYRCGLLPETLQASTLSQVGGSTPRIEVRMKAPPGGLLDYSAPPSHRLQHRDGELTLSLPVHGELPEISFQVTHYYALGMQRLRLRLTSYGAAPPMPPPNANAPEQNAEVADLAADPGLRAAWLNERGWRFYQQGQTAEAIAALSRSLDLAEPAGHISLTANSARLLAAVIFRQSKDGDKAERILDRYDLPLRLHAVDHAGATFERALIAQSRGRLQGAQSFFRQAMTEAVALNYADLRWTVASSYVSFLHQLGDHAAAQREAAIAQRELAALDVADLEAPCARSRQLAKIARAQAENAAAIPALLQTAQHSVHLAVEYAERDGCADPKALAHIYSSAARDYLLLAEGVEGSPPLQASPPPSLLAKVESRLGQALAISPSLTPQQRMDLGEVLGRLARLQGDYARAIPPLQEVEDLASRALAAEPRYRALIALASSQDEWARKMANKDEARLLESQARQNFAAAERLLSELVLFVPMTTARRGFLPRFEAGLAAYLDFLLRRSDLDEALAVMRRAQVRGLALALQGARLAPAQAAEADALQRDASELLQKSLQRQARLQTPDGHTVQSLEQQRQRLDEQLARLRQAGLGDLPLHTLHDREGMLICHDLPRARVACLYALASGQKQSLVFSAAELDAALSAGSPPTTISQLLLRSFAELIDQTSTLRIIPFYRLRSVEFAALPHPTSGDSLVSAQRAVVYALDVDARALPTQPPHSGNAREPATVVVYRDLASTPRVTPALLSRMHALGWLPNLYVPPVMETGYSPLRRLRCWLGLVDNCREPLLPRDLDLPVHPGTATAVLPSLQGVQLAHFYTHASFGGDQGGWESTILMPVQTKPDPGQPDDRSLRAGELMRLTPAPRNAVLITCEGGQSGIGQDVEDISLAQALLLRGSEAVIAASQKLMDPVAAMWSQALYDAAPADGRGAYLNAQQPDLRSAYHAAQLAMKSRPLTAASWTALRLHVP